jgi:glutamate N-acetyltransferase / amino-acid N-acetyltransferase
MGMTELPPGFVAHVANIGIKDNTEDLLILTAEHPSPAAGVFTRSRFAGPSVLISQDHIADGSARAFVVISKNANVATGPEGRANAEEVVGLTARKLGCEPEQVLIASTGVIGVPYPMELVRSHLRDMVEPFTSTSADDAARAMMTTDTHHKVASAAAGEAVVVGLAKGVGMIEPDMATLIVVLTTDASVSPEVLDPMFRRVVDRTFNALSVDTDTSTSDTAVALTSGVAGPVDAEALEEAFYTVALDLTRQLAADGEGAETLIVVSVEGARDDAQAKRVAKAIVNSPLVKTAVHGADPNWGRVAMAIGKCSDETDIHQDRVTISFGSSEVYPTLADAEGLDVLEKYLAGDEVVIHADLGIGQGAFTVYGCDLTDGYVRINADYTT